MSLHHIYIGTVLLERNRWRPGKHPSYLVGDWLDRFQEAGFDGIELWENHAAKAPPNEMARLQNASVPIAVLNSYAAFDDEGAAGRNLAVSLSEQLAAPRVKFNIGNDPGRLDEYIGNVIDWSNNLPAKTRPLCECHPGTVVETAEAAAEAFARWNGKGAQAEAIVHPFNLTPVELKRWFDKLGTAITHAHVQLNRQGQMLALADHPDTVRHNVNIMLEAGFTGTFTIEFTAGVRAPDENINDLFAAATRDLALLRRVLGR